MSRRQMLIGAGGVAILGAAATYRSLRRMGSGEEYAASVAAMRAAIATRPGMRELVRYATLAPNGHNTQPWRFRLTRSRIDILPDLTRRTPAVDPDDHHLFVSLGCAAETLAISAPACGVAGELRFEAADGGSVVYDLKAGSSPETELFRAVPVRQSVRDVYDGRAVSPEALDKLAKAALVPGVDVVLLTDAARIDRVRDLVVSGNSVQMADAAFVRELRSWLRFNPRQALATGDGLFSAASGSPALPSWLGPHLFDLMFRADAENEKYARQLRSTPLIAVFVGERADADHWVRVGRSCQRFALQATALGLKSAFINQPVEVPALRPDLAGLIGLPGRRPDIVMRVGYGPALPFSARRPIDSVIV